VVVEELLELRRDRECGRGAGDDEGGELVGAGCEGVGWDETCTSGGWDGGELWGQGDVVECYWERGAGKRDPTREIRGGEGAEDIGRTGLVEVLVVREEEDPDVNGVTVRSGV